MHATANEVVHRLDDYIEEARKEPVVVEQNGRRTAVIVSYEEYQRLRAQEDELWARRAVDAEAGGYVGSEAIQGLLRKAGRARA